MGRQADEWTGKRLSMVNTGRPGQQLLNIIIMAVNHHHHSYRQTLLGVLSLERWSKRVRGGMEIEIGGGKGGVMGGEAAVEDEEIEEAAAAAVMV